MATEQTQRTALITGASSGIGKAIAINFANENINVGLLGRDALRLELVAEQCRKAGVQARIYPVDLTERHRLKEIVDQAASELGGISILVNNAGICIEKNIRTACLADWDATIDLNLTAVFAITQCALPHLEKSKGAAIINIASIASRRAYAGGTMYCAAKHGLLAFSNSLFADLSESGIKVSAILPGHVDTDMHARRNDLNRETMIRPAEVAEAVRFVVNFPGGSCPTEITILPQRSTRKQFAR